MFFLQRTFRWKPENTPEVLEGFNNLLGIELKGVFGNARRAFRYTGKFPKWITEDIKQKLLTYWDGEKFKKRSETNRKNRLAEQVIGEGPTTHNTGRHSFYRKKKLMVYFIFNLFLI